ncbi:MAG: hypothetical protein WAK93_11185 [Solirubrobacteraceae bacterium]
MNEDWRVKVQLHEHGFTHGLTERLEARNLEHGLEASFEDRIVVSIDGNEVFCYAGSRDQAQRAADLISELARKNDWSLDLELAHWHPVAEEWEDPDDPLPTTPTEAAGEDEERIEEEREESAEQGYPEYEVRVQCASRGEAGSLSKRLQDEGITNVHRFNYVLIGAEDEASGRALAERVTGELGTATQVSVERNQRAVYDALPPNPFSVFGGLGA